MECEIETQNSEMADELQRSRARSMDQDQDLDDADVEAILNRSRGRRRKLNFYEAPEFVKRLNAFEEVKAGSTVVFACQWKALPKPAIKWYKDDEEITENERYKQELVDNSVQHLIIENCKKSDEGAYKCKAENQEGVASTTGYLSVTGPDPGESPPPPHSHSDHCISVPPPRGLRTIVEQKSLEEREEEEYSHLPPSPIQDFIDNASRRGHTWPYARLGYSPEDFAAEDRAEEGGSSDSDTSVESQEYDQVSFEVEPCDDELDGQDDSHPLVDHEDLFPIEDDSDVSPPVAYSDQQIAPFHSSSESEASSSDVSIPEIFIDTAANRRKRLKRLPLQRTSAIDTEQVPATSKHEKDDRNKAEKLANGGKPFQLAKVSKVALASFNTDSNKIAVIDHTEETPVEKAYCGVTSKERSAAPAPQTIQEVLGIDLVGILEQVLDSPLLYYVLFTSCCAFLGAATEAPVPFYVLTVAMLALVSFRLLLLHRPTLRKF